METYIGLKRVNARPLSWFEYQKSRGRPTPVIQVNKDAEGYLIEDIVDGLPNVAEYAGYANWLPKHIFEQVYRPIAALTFSQALEALQLGKRVARADWSEDTWLVLVKPGFYDVGCSVVGEVPTVDGFFEPWIGMKTAGKQFGPWSATQSDLLAEDWRVVD